MASVQAESQIIGNFLNDIFDCGYVLCTWQEDGNYGGKPVPVTESIEQILAFHFGIDLNKVEKERRAILEHIQKNNLSFS